jgi:hypothetical protein
MFSGPWIIKLNSQPYVRVRLRSISMAKVREYFQHKEPSSEAQNQIILIAFFMKYSMTASASSNDRDFRHNLQKDCEIARSGRRRFGRCCGNIWFDEKLLKSNHFCAEFNAGVLLVLKNSPTRTIILLLTVKIQLMISADFEASVFSARQFIFRLIRFSLDNNLSIDSLECNCGNPPNALCFFTN